MEPYSFPPKMNIKCKDMERFKVKRMEEGMHANMKQKKAV